MPSPHMTVPLVSLFTLGGTIATVPGKAEEQPSLTGDELVASLGDVGQIARLRTESLRQLPSADLRLSDMADVCQRVRDAIKEGACGVVITHGTDTLEETAFLLDILLDVPQPVVITGALRNPALPGADGAGNLLSAIRVAADAAAAGLGVLVVMNDEIHAARFVKKMHTYKPSAFSSPCTGPLGWVAESRVRIAIRPAEATPTIPWRSEPPDVPLITMGFSMTVGTISSFLRDPPAGIVIATFGAGHVPSWTMDLLGSLASNIPVVLASRIGVGEIFRETYDHHGSETDLYRRGCISAGYLDAMKARVLLALLLADGADRNRITDTFSRY
jgi:L-asparaginase